jgi:hypothetical protein
MDRLSDRRFVANYFRLYLHAVAMNLPEGIDVGNEMALSIPLLPRAPVIDSLAPIVLPVSSFLELRSAHRA